VERDARPSEALHMGHVGIIIQVRVVLGVFLDDAENTGGRLASPLATRHWRPQNPAVLVIDSNSLIAQRDDGHDRLAGGT
jgi:hypothetical protein